MALEKNTHVLTKSGFKHLWDRIKEKLSLKADKSDLNKKQDKLISGTNIKTINNTSVLGSENFNLIPRIEYASKTAMDADSTQQNGTIGYDRDGEIWYIYDQTNGEWRQIDASGGGGNITLKTINNTSLIGSGNIEVQPKKFIIDITRKGAHFTYSKTYAEIMAAYNTGADIEIHEGYAQYVYRLVNYNEDEECFSFVADDDTDPLTKYWWKVNSNDEWDTDESLYQLKLLSGQTIKTINNTSLLGSGNISISGGSTDLTNYYTKSEIDTMIGDVETILASI